MTFIKWHDEDLLTADNYGSNLGFSQVGRDYDTLRMNKNTPRADWVAWYHSLVPYFQAQNIFVTHHNYLENIRSDAIYLALLALFGGEYTLKSKYHLPDEEKDYRRACYHWVFQKAMEAHEIYPDVMTYFIKHLEYNNSDPDLSELVNEDLEQLYKKPPPFVDPNLIRTIQIYHTSVDDDSQDAKIKEWIGLLDDPSIMVACAAANAFSKADLLGEQLDKLIVLITQKELERPGVAGAFYAPYHFDYDLFSGDDAWKKTVEWMMDLMERRKGKPEFGPNVNDTLKNDISFYLHELCDFMPNMVERMMKSGFDELALMTATEQRAKVDGMEKPLIALMEKYQKDSAKSDISLRAKRHLEEFYQ